MKKIFKWFLVLALMFAFVPRKVYALESKHNINYVKERNEISSKEWKLGDTSRIVILKNSKTTNNTELYHYVQLVDAEMFGDGKTLPIHVDSFDTVKDGDIVITLDYNKSTTFDEEYQIDVGNYVTIASSSPRGILYGLRTFSTLLETKDLTYKKITDYPEVADRMLHIDTARYNYSKDWIIQRIKQMSYLRLNTLQLHFSENEGFGIECKTVPNLAGKNALSYDDVNEILDIAALYGVDVIPSLDSPGHLGKLINIYPEYGLNQYETYQNEQGDTLYKDDNNDGIPNLIPVVYGGANCNCSALDITNQNAKDLIYRIYDEYAQLFKDSKYFNICADEFITFSRLEIAKENRQNGFENIDGDYPTLSSYAKENGYNHAIDYIVDYVNELATHLEEKGFTVSVFNDGFYRDANQTKDLKQSIQICYWSSMLGAAPVQTFIDKGHKVINFCDKAETNPANMTKAMMYYVNNQYMYAHPEGDNIYNNWHPGIFSNWFNMFNGGSYEKNNYPKNLQGASFCIWNDTNTNDNTIETPKETAQNIAEPLLAMSQVCWNAKINSLYTDYQTFISAYKNASDMRGYNSNLTLPNVLNIDYSRLQAIVDELSHLDQTKYTENSVKELTNGLTASKKLLSQRANSQEEVDCQYEQLLALKMALVLKKETSKKSETVGKETKVISKKKNSVNTGDDTVVGIFVIMCLLSILSLYVIRKKYE